MDGITATTLFIIAFVAGLAIALIGMMIFFWVDKFDTKSPEGDPADKWEDK